MKLLFFTTVLTLFLQRCSAGGLLIPLYSWPDISANGSGGYDCVDPDFAKVATSAASHKTIAVVNPNNGPDYGGDSWKKLSYDTCIAYLRSNGAQVVGYVHTKVGYPDITGYRPMLDVQSDINMWLNQYTVDGIFVDEMTNRWPSAAWDSESIAIDFYQAVVDYIFDQDSALRVVLNPGSVYFESIMAPYYGNPQVISVVFESMQWNYQRGNCLWSLWSQEQGSFNPGPFCNYVPEWDNVEPLVNAMVSGTIARDQSAVMIYGATAAAADTADSFVHGLAYNVGWYYVTDRWDWAATPGDVVWNEQVSQALLL